MAAMMPGAPPLRHLDLDLQSHIRSIPDFPKPGILFRDINPMLRSPEAMAEVIRQLGDNLKLLGSSDGELVQAGADQWLAMQSAASGRRPFDIVS